MNARYSFSTGGCEPVPTQVDVDAAFAAWRNLALAIDTYNPNDRALVENHWRKFCDLDDKVNGKPSWKPKVTV